MISSKANLGRLNVVGSPMVQCMYFCTNLNGNAEYVYSFAKCIFALAIFYSYCNVLQDDNYSAAA